MLWLWKFCTENITSLKFIYTTITATAAWGSGSGSPGPLWTLPMVLTTVHILYRGLKHSQTLVVRVCQCACASSEGYISCHVNRQCFCSTMSFTRGSAQKMNECHIVRIWSKRTVTFVNISQTVLKIFYPKHYTIFNYFISPCVSG